MAAPGSGAFARFIGSVDCTFATVERRKNATIRPSGATSLSSVWLAMFEGSFSISFLAGLGDVSQMTQDLRI